ncbi:hypothetical protein BCR36DRAFT_341477 [Piromyces finnis]|uniref:Uncharacterized protein n=1 Tax=Piromyces finnis TaxID=1754191 RepID=A0A1Y1VPT9_9FUNG|nr:hypothetical protein BCR36DRAFT_341477 [Piromyces finnis]|eukprot:ORX61153.1 hypothetical protein BCR36DRAFT_341477 [Piromyces finnis]
MDYLSYCNRRVITIKPTVNIVFKRLFGNEKNKDILVHFLNSVLKYYGHSDFNVNNVKFIDEKLRADDLEENFPNADILVSKFKRLTKENDEELVNIEIHVSNVSSRLYRSEFYASRLMTQSVFKGQKYGNIPEIIMLNILDYIMFDDRIGYRYFPRNGVAFYKGKFYQNVNEKLYDKKMNILTDKNGNDIIMDNDDFDFNCQLSTIHFIELPKFKTKNENNNDNNVNNNDILDNSLNNDNKDDDNSDEDLNLWIQFLNNPNDPIFRKEDTKDIYKKARFELLFLQDDEKFEKEYWYRIDSIITEKSIREHDKRKYLKEGREEGEEIEEKKGIIKGRKEGEEIGIRKSQIKTTFKLFHSNLDSSFIKTLSELPENEINIIDEFLKKSERNATDLAEKLNIDANFIYETCDSFKLSYNTSNEDDESKNSKKIKI